ncbi:MAG: hypothetical protein ACR2PL_17050 [Dehalococcoidia bacterium]
MEGESRRVLICLDGHVVTIKEWLVSSEWDGGRAEVMIDEGKPTSFDFPGWQEHRFAMISSSALLLWSARELYLLSLPAGAIEQLYESDEDILLVYPFDGGLLVVCETTLRTLDRLGRQVCRLELPEAVASASLNYPRVKVTNVEGNQIQVELKGLSLTAIATPVTP